MSSIFKKITQNFIRRGSVKKVVPMQTMDKKKIKRDIKVRTDIYPYNFPKNKWSPRI
jgi:hypothetical protein